MLAVRKPQTVDAPAADIDPYESVAPVVVDEAFADDVARLENQAHVGHATLLAELSGENEYLTSRLAHCYAIPIIQVAEWRWRRWSP